MTRLEAIAALEELKARYPAPQSKPPQAMTPGEKIGSEVLLAIACFYDLPAWMKAGYPRFASMKRLMFLLHAEEPSNSFVAEWLARNLDGMRRLAILQGDLPWGVVDPSLPKGVDR